MLLGEKKVHMGVDHQFKTYQFPTNPTHTFSVFSPLVLLSFRFLSHLDTKLSIIPAPSVGLAEWIVLQGKAASTSFRSDNIHGIQREREAGHWAWFSFPSLESQRRREKGREGENQNRTFIVLCDPGYTAD